MANWGAFSQGFSSGFNRMLDQKEKKKAIEQELKNKMALMGYGAQLENQALIPEQKLLQTFQSNPELFQQYQTSKDPFKQQELGLQGRGLDIRQQEANTEAAYKKFIQSSGGGASGAGPKQRDFQFLMSLPGMTQEQALKYLFRPDMMSQLMGSGLFGAPQSGGFANGE